MVITIVVLSLLVLLFIYISHNLLKKLEETEEVADAQFQKIERFTESVRKQSGRLKIIDDRGIFKADDEIGWFFDSLKEIQKELDNL